MSLHVDFLYLRDCPHQERARQLLREVLRELNVKATWRNQRIDSRGEALAKRFLGSPSIRLNGVDLEPSAQERTGYGLQSRLYQNGSRLRGMPSKAMMRAALQRVLAQMETKPARVPSLHRNLRRQPRTRVRE